MNSLEKISAIKKELKDTQLIIVTKKQTIETIKKVYNYGEREFAENRINDLIRKKNLLPKDIKWHLIGHLQTKKVKKIIPFIHLIQSVDSVKILNTINKYAEKQNRIINCLIQIKISKEKTKFGFSTEEGTKLLNSDLKEKYPNISIKGIMCMATFTQNKNIIKKEFQIMKNIFDKLTIKNPILSMGMSNDYKLAQKLGSNMVRIGSLIFKN